MRIANEGKGNIDASQLPKLIAQPEQQEIKESYLYLPALPVGESYVISMAPINSSGDIYHILAFIILSLANKKSVPMVQLTYDGSDELQSLESKINVYSQAMRCFAFAQWLGYGQYFLPPIDIKSNGPRQVARNAALARHFKGKYFADKPNIVAVNVIEQKALTTMIAAHTLDAGLVPTQTQLLQGFNSISLPQQCRNEFENQCQNAYRKIATEAGDKPLIIIHARYSSHANETQNLTPDFLTRLKEYLIANNHAVWFIFADSRIRGSYTSINEHRTDPFPFYLASEAAQADLRNDYGKLFHLSLLLRLLSLKKLVGIIGNTSGLLDVASFIGHRVFDMHQFEANISYQGLRIIIQSNLMVVSYFSHALLLNKATDQKGKQVPFTQEMLDEFVPNLTGWMNVNSAGQALALNDKKFTMPNLDNEAYVDMLFFRRFGKDGSEKQIKLSCSDDVMHSVNGVFKK